jgi:hypothetical protein
MSPTEPTLYAALRHAGVPNDGWCSASAVLALAARLGISTVRLDEVLAEWARCGWWTDHGNFDGYFTDHAPYVGDVMKREPETAAWLVSAQERSEANAHTFDVVRP